ncbi:MAG: hypothetical protein ACLP5H_10895 [Desulfomonilaceae bacterium]
MNIDPQHLLQDALRELTRKERRNLLGVATTGIVAVVMELRPTAISALGISFDAAQYMRLLSVWGWIVVYFLAAFVIYAVSDVLSRRVAIIDSSWKKQIDDHQHEAEQQEKLEQLASGSQGPDIDFVVSGIAGAIGINTREKQRREKIEMMEQEMRPYQFLSQLVLGVRLFFDLGLPILIGLISLWLLFGKYGLSKGTISSP